MKLVFALTLLMVYQSIAQAQIVGDLLPDPSYKLLLSKPYPDASPVISFNGNTVGLAHGRKVILVDVNTGTSRSMKLSSEVDPDTVLPLMSDSGGLYVASGDRIFFMSEQNAPKSIWKANSRIRWVERKSDQSAIITKSGQIAILANGVVNVVGSSPTADASAVLGGIEVRDATPTGSWIKLYNRNDLKASCTIPGIKLYRATLSQDGQRAFGLLSKLGNDKYQHLAAYNCADGKEAWKVSIYKDLLSGGTDQLSNYERLAPVTAFGTLNACGAMICANLQTDDTAIGVVGVSGVYCADQLKGAGVWKTGVSIEEGSTKRLTGLLCRSDRLVTFSNYPPFLGTQAFPTKIEQEASLIDSESTAILKDIINPGAFITNPMIRPLIAKGRVAFLSSDGHLLVFGK
jgi:hypothetical protein